MSFVALTATNLEAVDWHRVWRYSLAAVCASNAMDAVTSWQQPEANPLLAVNGRFGARGLAIKSSIMGTAIAVQFAIERKRRPHKLLTITNFAVASSLTAIVIRNQHAKQANIIRDTKIKGASQLAIITPL